MDQKVVVASVIGGVVGGIVTLSAYGVLKRVFGNKIARFRTQDPRSSGSVVCNGLLYTSGQVGDIDKVCFKRG